MTDRPVGFGVLLTVGFALAGCSDAVTLPKPEGPEPPGYALSIRQEGEVIAEPSKPVYLDVVIHREPGFDGQIAFSTEAPPGIVAYVQPRLIFKRGDTDLVIVAEQAAERRKHTVVITGKATGLADRQVVVEFTLVD